MLILRCFHTRYNESIVAEIWTSEMSACENAKLALLMAMCNLAKDLSNVTSLPAP